MAPGVPAGRQVRDVDPDMIQGRLQVHTGRDHSQQLREPLREDLHQRRGQLPRQRHYDGGLAAGARTATKHSSGGRWSSMSILCGMAFSLLFAGGHPGIVGLLETSV